jgi:glycosyltransferase involved in cell wall biosynthesis
VLIQAMACGTPVVSTDCPSGPREVLEGGRLGPLVPVGDAEALALAIAQTLDAPLPAETLKARAAQYGLAPVSRRCLAALRLAKTG